MLYGGSSARRSSARGSKRAATGCGTGASAPTPCGAWAASGWTTGAGLCRIKTTRPASICGGRVPRGHRRARRQGAGRGSIRTRQIAATPSDRGARFHAAESKKSKGASAFEKRLGDLGARRVPTGAARHQPDGKPERARGEMQRNLICSMMRRDCRAYVPSTRRTSGRIPRRGSRDGATVSGRTCR